MNIVIADRMYNTYDMIEKASKLKKDGIIKFTLYSCTNEDFEYFRTNQVFDKLEAKKLHYTWVFLNCKVDSIHLAPDRWSYDPGYKNLIISFKFDDVVGSNSDAILKGKIRDKKLKDLFR